MSVCLFIRMSKCPAAQKANFEEAGGFKSPGSKNEPFLTFFQFFIENMNIFDDFSEFLLIINHSRKFDFFVKKSEKFEFRILAPIFRTIEQGLDKYPKFDFLTF